MNSTIRKAIVAGALGLFPVLMQLIPQWRDFLQSIGSKIGSSLFYSLGLDNFLNGFFEESIKIYYPNAFLWCWYAPLVLLALLYLVLDKVTFRSVFHWLTMWLGAGLICAVHAYTEVNAARQEIPQLDEVASSGDVWGWALLNFLIALLIGLILSYFLSRVSINAKHSPLAGNY